MINPQINHTVQTILSSARVQCTQGTRKQ